MPTTLSVPVSDAALAHLKARADALGTTPEAVAAAELERVPRKSDTDPLMKLAGMFSTGVSDAAERHDHYLGQSLADELRRDGP